MSTQKRFTEWIVQKEFLHDKAKQPLISEGEVWWCAVGENVGVEINGKHAQFSRPVLVYKKFGERSFLAIPLSSQVKHGSWYVNFWFHGKQETAVLAQMRILSVARLYNQMGEIDETDFKRIKSQLLRVLS